MATKLKNLRVKKVDFVDAGANQGADVLLFKKEDGTPKIQPGAEAPKREGMWKRFISAIGKVAGMKPEEIDATIDEISKSGEAETFGDKMAEASRSKILDEVWEMCYALQSSLQSIICDDAAGDAAQELMTKSLEEFDTVMNSAICHWALGKTAEMVKKSMGPVSEEELKCCIAAKERLESIIEKSGKESNNNHEPKGEETDMSKIDKSKMTPAEKVFFEDIEKRYGMGESGTAPIAATTAATEPIVTKSAVPPLETAVQPPATNEDIYKGLHPAVADELKALRKRADEAEEKELADIAKRYGIIGKKQDELAPVLKSLKAAGGAAYENMIAILDASVEAVEKSGMFAEIGKSGGRGEESDAWTKIEKKADEIQASNPSVSRMQAIDTVCLQNPQLVRDYEEGR